MNLSGTAEVDIPVRAGDRTVHVKDSETYMGDHSATLICGQGKLRFSHTKQFGKL